MKRELLIWNIVLSVAVIALLILHFGSKKRTAGATTITAKDTIVHNKSFRIAYFEMDSVAANFGLVKELETELTNREEAINTEMNTRGREIQQKINYYQNLAEKGSLSQEQSESASKEIKGMDDAMKTRKQQLDLDYSNYKMSKSNEIKTKIEDFLKEYNSTRDYTYIVSYEQGLFYYKDTAYNITTDLVKGLNQKYRPEKKAK
ncbi:MAG TPA: OmpH family outer membrane protein [Chitinophagaceae bacterium]|jgi:outer membrane protein|nr:OmpH family outer membrane protein [Chitinophagaceae bacterium]